MKLLHSSIAATAALVICGNVLAAPPTAEVNVVNTVDANVVNTVDTNVVNTVDTNVVNTVDTNVVTTVSSDGLVGLDFGPGVAANVTAILGGPRRLLSISTGIAPDVPGEYCGFSVKAGVGDTTTIEPIGFSAMSNGEVANVSRNYTVPIDPVQLIEWKITSTSGSCWVSLSFVTEPSDVTEPSESASSTTVPEGQHLIELEIR